MVVTWTGVSYQVVSQELHDQGGVLVALLAQSIQLCKWLVPYLDTGQEKEEKREDVPAMASSKASLARWQA